MRYKDHRENMRLLYLSYSREANMLRKSTILAIVLAVLLTGSAPLVLAQQDGGIVPEEDPAGSVSYPEVTKLDGSDTDCPPPGDPQMRPCISKVGFVQYSSEPPPGSYYDCPPDTEPRMLRPCILVTP